MTKQEFASALAEFDGVAVSVLSQAQVAFRPSESYWDDLVDMSRNADPRIADGATWILKAELSNGATLSGELTDRLINGFQSVTSWQAVLHLCQCVEHLTLTEEQATQMVSWAQSHQDHSRPFVRAWSLHAVVVAAMRFSNLRDKAASALERAEKDTAASVKARARNLRKTADKS